MSVTTNSRSIKHSSCAVRGRRRSARLWPVRSTLAGLFFTIAYALASLAVAGFLLQRTAFDPNGSADSVGVVLDDTELKTALVDFIVDNTATALTDSPQQIEELRALVTTVAGNSDGEKFFAGIVHDAHAHMIGDSDGPVIITGEQLVPIVRNQGVGDIGKGDIPPIVLPVPRVTPLVIVNRALDWGVPIAAILALLLVVIGITAHPERETALRWLAYGLVLVAIVVAIIGYVVPRFIIGLASDSVWANIPARMADAALPLLIGLEMLLLGGALGIFAGSGMVRRRRRWNAPINTYRYTQDRWG